MKSADHVWNSQFVPYNDSYLKKIYRHVEHDTGRRYALGDLTGPGGKAKGNPKYEFLGVERYWRYSKSKMFDLLSKGRIAHRDGRVPLLKRYLDEMPGKPVQDLWDDIKPCHGSKLKYPTQKPESLLKRIIETSSLPGQVLYDPFAGSGTSGVACFKMSRRWIASEISTNACNIIRRRLKAIGCQVEFSSFDAISRAANWGVQ